MLFAIIVMVIVRTLFFDLFRIPTPSMEKSLLVGDYLFVSKLHYGTRTPMSLGIPFTQFYIKGFEAPWTRTPGFSKVTRGDAIVFNWPAGTKSPIDRKMHYIKRVVGLPGESVELQDKVVHVNGEASSLAETMQQHWYAYKQDPNIRLPRVRLRDLGINYVSPTSNPSIVRILATTGAAEQLKEWPYIERIEPAIGRSDGGFHPSLFPRDKNYTTDNYGPVIIPKAGQEVALTQDNWAMYERVIRVYEGHATASTGDAFEIDGESRSTYTFAQDYFFVMGDNRDNSEDSRFWGFVPMDHVVGKAVMVYFSWDAEGSPRFFGQVRFKRVFSLIK